MVRCSSWMLDSAGLALAEGAEAGRPRPPGGLWTWDIDQSYMDRGYTIRCSALYAGTLLTLY